MKNLNEIVDNNIDYIVEQYNINESLTLLALYAGKEIVKRIRLKTDSCYKKCHKMENRLEVKFCYNECRNKLNNEKIKELKKINCNERNDPYKCKIRITKEIENLKQNTLKRTKVLAKIKSKKIKM